MGRKKKDKKDGLYYPEEVPCVKCGRLFLESQLEKNGYCRECFLRKIGAI